jgi:hypothetical protein
MRTRVLVDSSGELACENGFKAGENWNFDGCWFLNERGEDVISRVFDGHVLFLPNKVEDVSLGSAREAYKAVFLEASFECSSTERTLRHVLGTLFSGVHFVMCEDLLNSYALFQLSILYHRSNPPLWSGQRT